MTLSFFGKGSKSFVSVSHDNRIKLIDVESRSEQHSFVERHHLSHSYVCSAWGQSSAEDVGQFAVGCSDGTIVVWDFVRGVSKTIGKANELPVPTDIEFSRDLKSILVSSNMSQIIEYDIKSGTNKRQFKTSKKGSQRICLNPSVDAIATVRFVSTYLLIFTNHIFAL